MENVHETFRDGLGHLTANHHKLFFFQVRSLWCGFINGCDLVAWDTLIIDQIQLSVDVN